VNNFLAAFGRDIFGTHLPFSVNCIGLTKGVPKFGITFGPHSYNVDMNSAKKCLWRPLDGQDMLKGNDFIEI